MKHTDQMNPVQFANTNSAISRLVFAIASLSLQLMCLQIEINKFVLKFAKFE